jgi:hypothetical protein
MSNINLKQCDRCGAMRDANTAFCGNCGKQYDTSGENSPTPFFGEHQQGPITPRLSGSGFYTPAQHDYASPPPPRSRSNRIYLVMIALLVLMLIGTFVFFLGKGSSQGSTGTTPSTPNQVGSNPANNSATSTVAIASPTDSTTTHLALTATPTGLTLAPAETLPENITLKCDCTDPVVVTIIKIVVEPPQNRMIWSLTFFNNSQSGADASFYQFSLQKGDQVNYPTTGEQTYSATGGGINTDVFLQAGETKQATLTFSFVPYKDIPYTLSSELEVGFAPVTFNPVVIQF